MAAPIASGTGAPLASLVLTRFGGTFGLHGWQMLFLLLGFPTILLGIVIFRLLPSRPAEAAWLSAEERCFLEGELERERPETTGAPPVSPFSALRSPQVLALALIFFGFNAGSYLLNFFLSQVIRSLGPGTAAGISTVQVGLLAAVPWLTAVAVMYFAARHSDRTGDRVRHAFAGAALSAGALCTAPFVGNGIAAIVLLSVAAAGLHVAMPLFWQLPPRYLPLRRWGPGSH